MGNVTEQEFKDILKNSAKKGYYVLTVSFNGKKNCCLNCWKTKEIWLGPIFFKAACEGNSVLPIFELTSCYYGSERVPGKVKLPVKIFS